MASNFERKYGKYAIKKLSVYLIVAYIIGYMLQIISPEISAFLAFNPYWIFRGQVWRIFTWILMPPAFHIYNYHAFTVLPVRSGVRKSMGNLQIQCIYFFGIYIYHIRCFGIIWNFNGNGIFWHTSNICV